MVEIRRGLQDAAIQVYGGGEVFISDMTDKNNGMTICNSKDMH